ncbi:unnamed protein product [Malus baccata var. baccata]
MEDIKKLVMVGMAVVLIVSTFATKTAFASTSAASESASDHANSGDGVTRSNSNNESPNHSVTRFSGLKRINMAAEGGGVGKSNACKGSICNAWLLPCKSGCYCIPIGILPIGLCAGICCSN